VLYETIRMTVTQKLSYCTDFCESVPRFLEICDYQTVRLRRLKQFRNSWHAIRKMVCLLIYTNLRYILVIIL